MKVLIIEDERYNYFELARLLARLRPEWDVDGPLVSVKETSEYLRVNSPDLIFADIHIQDGIVFDAFEDLPLSTRVVFTTAYSEHAIQAFSYNAVDYLLKPIIEKKLEETVKKLEDIDSSSLVRLSQLADFDRRDNRNAFKTSCGTLVLRNSEIAYVEIESGEVVIRCKTGERFRTSMTLEGVEEILNQEVFVRINRQQIVNLFEVKSYKKAIFGKLEVTMKSWWDTPSMTVSRRYVRRFIEGMAERDTYYTRPRDGASK